MLHKNIEILDFKNQADFIAWLNTNYKDERPYWVKLVKKHSLESGISYIEAREAALMYGWIDGLANRLNDDYFLVKFTHRRPKSVWSKINVAIVEDLMHSNKMHVEGLSEVEKAKDDGRWDAAY
jgi:uncharacterized protein YdeI (YjbR/CyaY-like superfamily)